MDLLSSVDQQKEQCESARSYCSHIEWKSRGLINQRIDIACTGGAAPAGLACSSEVIDDVIGFLTLEALNDAAEPGGEETNIVVEGDVLRTSVRITRNCARGFSRGRVRFG